LTTSDTMIAFSAEGFNALLDQLDEPGWLSDLRRDAWNQFESAAWPTRREEEWMRTEIRGFHLDRFPLAQAVEGVPAPTASLREGVELAGSITSVGGETVEATLTEEAAAKGVIFAPLDVFAREHSELLKEHLMQRAFDASTDKFAMLHAACMKGGGVLYVPARVQLENPLHIFNVMPDGGSDLSHALVILEDGAQATLLSENRSATEDSGGLHCGGVELLVGKNAHLRYVNLQEWGNKVWHFAHQKGVVDRNGSLQWTIGALGSKLAKVNQHVGLIGQNASCQVNGVMFTEGKQHLSYHTLQHHEAEACTSDLLYKAALQDKSQTVWRGMIKVDSAAQKTDGYQRNDNLLLSSTARADSIPGLEIEADDVRCTHGSTSGRVDEELIFYCTSRGFTRKEAIRMIVAGFFQQIFDRITIPSVREALGVAIARRVREYE
jgi:Fe-S cluster assembly protein SufD